ncbi:SAM-dependent methyltransferase [alpha proteobacterium BAL199]|jgi:FkbM family methyltransferase|nr:SAM-dependent methyltransferase [alpha proteobacterium BAL199]
MIGSVELDWRFGTIEVPAPDRYIRQAIQITGEYSGAEIDLYQALLRPSDVAIDVGANVGVFSIAIGQSVGPSGRVLAFEPQPPIYEFLKRNISRSELEHVQMIRAIVARRDGVAEFIDVQTLPEGEEVNFGGLGVHSSIRRRFGRFVPTDVRCIDGMALDRCDFIKIDAEGTEGAVVVGATATIARCRPVVSFECDRPDVAGPLVDTFLAAGYRLWRFRGSNMRVPNPKGAILRGFPNISILMLLAVPDERLDRLAAADMSTLRTVDSRQTFDRLSQGIVKDAL